MFLQYIEIYHKQGTSASAPLATRGSSSQDSIAFLLVAATLEVQNISIAHFAFPFDHCYLRRFLTR
jgi:hypothetical protein